MGNGVGGPIGPGGSGLNAFRFPVAGHPGFDTGVSVLAIVLHFTFLVLLVLAAVWIVREILGVIRRRGASAPPLPSAAVTELEMLYARGEITRSDYLTRRADLTGVPQTAPPLV
jgi:uncharacterized membrane protein